MPQVPYSSPLSQHKIESIVMNMLSPRTAMPQHLLTATPAAIAGTPSMSNCQGLFTQALCQAHQQQHLAAPVTPLNAGCLSHWTIHLTPCKVSSHFVTSVLPEAPSCGLGPSGCAAGAAIASSPASSATRPTIAYC